MGFTLVPGMTGGRVRDAGGGDGGEGPPPAFGAGARDQGDLPGAGAFAEGGAEGPAVRRDGVPLRADAPADAEAGRVAGGAGPAAGGECGACQPGAADADARVRGAARPWLRGRLRHG